MSTDERALMRQYRHRRAHWEHERSCGWFECKLAHIGGFTPPTFTEPCVTPYRLGVRDYVRKNIDQVCRRA